MKRILSIITLLSLIPFLGFAKESQDPRFKNGVGNLYVNELTEGMMKAFGCEGWKLINIQKVTKLGSAHVVDFSIALEPKPAIPPVTEKDFERLKGFIEPFFKGQVELYKKGSSSRTHDGMMAQFELQIV